MIIVRIAEGAWQHAGARFSEYVGSAALFLWGYSLYSTPDVFASSRSFWIMAQWADQAAWANLMMAGASFRAVGLALNGTFATWRPYTPTLRFIGSMTAFVAWSAVALGMFYAWLDGQGLPTGPIAYGVFIAPHEWRNIILTRRDMVAVRRGADAMARKP